MVVAMAAWSLGLHFSAADNSLIALEKTICNAPLLKLKSSSGFAATKPCYVLHKRRGRGRGRGRGRDNAQYDAVQETATTNDNVVGEDTDGSAMDESGKGRGRGKGNAHANAVQQTVDAVQQTATTNETVVGEDTYRLARW